MAAKSIFESFTLLNCPSRALRKNETKAASPTWIYRGANTIERKYFLSGDALRSFRGSSGIPST